MTAHPRRLILGLLWLSLAALGCGEQRPGPATTLAQIPRKPGYQAGVALADITPPLHLSLFGHGPESRVATGVRLRLHCQAFVLAAEDDVVALVPCDLQAPSMALQRAIADRLQRAAIPIGADRLYLMATHTHAGPAHYFEARRYSGTFSSSAPGYDPQVVDYLADKIAAAIATAYAGLAPACLGWPPPAKLFGLTFNRSYVPFLANHADAPVSASEHYDPLKAARAMEQRQHAAPKSSLMDASEATPRGSDDPNAAATPPARAGGERETRQRRGLPLTPAEGAIDPSLFVLRVDRRASDAPSCDGSQPIGVLAVFGMHPTGIPNTNELYHGDIFGFAVRAAEGKLSRVLSRDPSGATSDNADASMTDPWSLESAPPDAPRRVIVGLANGIEGDVSPKLNYQSTPEARKLGRQLGEAIADQALSRDALSHGGALRHLYWDLRFPGGRASERDDTLRLCERAELGMVAAGGARDGPTRVRIITEANAGFRPNRPVHCHDYKFPLRGPGTSHYDFPEVAPIGILRIGNGWIATIPGEPTTVSGSRIRARLRKGIPDAAVDPLAVVGLTNQYMQYFATPEEYRFQFYEGASTLYGPNSAPFLARHFGCLADFWNTGQSACSEQPATPNRPLAIDSDPEPIHARWPDEEDPPLLQLDEVRVRQLPREGALGWEMTFERLPLQFTSDRDSFSVQVLDADNETAVYDDDRGASIEVREVEADRWRVRWIPDLAAGDPRCDKRFRLAVRGRVHFTSRPFSLDCSKLPTGGTP